MSKYIIKPGQKGFEEESSDSLFISELFCDTFQGEGTYSGCPAVFLRLAGCPLNCVWCDTKSVWEQSTKISIKNLVKVFVEEKLVERMKNGAHLVITGGSPLLQQKALKDFLVRLLGHFNTKPVIEIENEGSQVVKEENMFLFEMIDCWNCSPKLGSSKVPFDLRVNSKALLQLNHFAKELWFKFVIDEEGKDWEEIKETFIDKGFVRINQIILMPIGCTRQELTVEKRVKVAELAIKHNVRYGGRLHIDLYNDKKGV